MLIPFGGGFAVTASQPAPVLQATGAQADGGATLDVPYPSSPQAGDLLIMWVLTLFNGSASAPAGWSTALNPPSTNFLNAYVYYKIAAGGETGTVTWSPGSVQCHGHMDRWSGADTSSPFAASTNNQASDSGGHPVTGSVTTTRNNSVLVLKSGFNANSGDVANPSGMTQNYSHSDVQDESYWQNYATAGTTDTKSQDQGSDNLMTFQMLAIQPPP